MTTDYPTGDTPPDGNNSGYLKGHREMANINFYFGRELRRFKTQSEQLADKWVIKLRRKGRDAWTEKDGDDHFVCVMVETVTGVPCVA